MTEHVWSPIRRLGRDGPQVSALGIGTWAMGGPWTSDHRDAGWGPVEDEVSVAALHTAIAAGVRLIDTAAVYGTGHSERVVGRALVELDAISREAVVVATKFGPLFDESARTSAGTDVTAEGIRAQCEASLRRLGIEAIGLYQLHGGVETASAAEDVVATLEDLVAAGKVRHFGTSVDAPQVVETFARSSACVAVQTQVNIFGWSSQVLEIARRHGLTVIARSSLAMGLLSGRYRPDSRPERGDVRLDTPWWTYFDDGDMTAWLDRLDRVRDLLTTDGRSLVQGALAYLWALDEAIIPLPGVRTPEQAQENVTSLQQGPLSPQAATAITDLLADSPERS